MQRRRFLAVLAAAPLLALGACGDDSPSSSATQPPATDATLPPVDDTVPPRYAHPTGEDEVILRIAYEGGFVPVEVAFANLPTLLVSGGGLVIQPGPQIAIYPGPLLPNLQQRTISEDGIQELLALAAEHGLLQERSYRDPTNIADAPFTVVTLTVDGVTYEHRAYALGIDDGIDGAETDEGREQLQAFIEAATALATGPESDVLGAEEPYATESYLVRSFPVDDTSGYEVEPTFVEWPADIGVRLADAAECAAIPAADVAELFADASQLTFFTEDGIDYSLAVKPALPGASTC